MKYHKTSCGSAVYYTALCIFCYLQQAVVGAKVYPVYQAKFFRSPHQGQCSGVLTSPNFPEPYPNLTHGYYHVKVPANNAASVYIQLLDLNDRFLGTSVDIFDGVDNSSNLLAQLSGHVANKVYKGSSDSLYIKFHSFSNLNRHMGFQLMYFSRPLNSESHCPDGGDSPTVDPCAGGYKIIEAAEGSVTSAGYPENYENNVKCGWMIDVSKFGRQIRIKWKDFELESKVSGICENDQLKVYDPSRLRTIFLCGKDTPSLTMTGGPYLFLQLKSDKSETWRGFSLSFKAIG